METRDVRLSELGQIITGKTPPTKNPGYYGGETPFLTPSDDMNGKYAPETARKLSESGVGIVRRCLLPAGSICMSCIGSDLGKVVVTREPLVTNQQINSIIPSQALVDLDYLYYSMLPLGRRLNALSKTSTAVPIVNKSTFSDCIIALPDIRVQRAIGHVLATLDQKIEINRRTNDYLAELLDVQFDNLIANESSDWETASLLDIASYKNGLAMQRFRPVGDDPGLPVLKIRELGQGYCGNDAERCRSDIDVSVAIHDGDLVFSWSGTLLLDFWAGGDAGLNQHLFKVTSDVYPSWFYYMWTKQHMQRFIALAKDRATTMGHIKRSALQESEVLIPPADVMVELTAEMQPIVDEMIGLKVQSRKLGELRDALLPRLMSGEIDVSDVELPTQPNNHLSSD